MRYRKEIDGLRALAVIPVILFHAGFKIFNGGFVGVDVFFVISGYLITTIILIEKEAGTFSIKNFYQKRARRILPALFFVMLCCLPFVWVWMFPDQLRSFAKSLVAVSIFASNIFFQKGKGVDYFEPSNEEMPLLHTWSLAVEEQYYIIFPFFIALFWRFGKPRLLFFIIISAIISFSLAEWSSHIARHFYSSPKRAWEILVGAICAFYLLEKNEHKSSQWLSLIGMGLILLSIFAFDKNTPYPSLYTLIPVFGTALIILFGAHKTFVSRILSTPVLVGVGLISYSAYLWHYPLLAFARIRSLNEPTSTQLLLLSALSLLLGWVTWRFIEQPFRVRQGRKPLLSQKKLTLSAVYGVSFFISIGVICSSGDGFESRFNGQVLSILSNNSKEEILSSKSCLARKNISLEVNPCIYGSPDHVRFAVLGDSHGLSLSDELGQGLSEKGGTLIFARPACNPIRGVSWVEFSKPERDIICQKFKEIVYNYLVTSSVDTIILIARWTLIVEGTPFSNLEGGLESEEEAYFDVVGHDSNDSEEERKARVTSRFIEGIKEILSLKKKVILVYPIPEAGWDVPIHLAKASIHGEDFDGMLSTSFEVFKNRNALTYSTLDSIEHPDLIRIKPGEIFCDSFIKGRCLNQLNGVSLYRDDDHLSKAGAKLVVERILNALNYKSNLLDSNR